MIISLHQHPGPVLDSTPKARATIEASGNWPSHHGCEHAHQPANIVETTTNVDESNPAPVDR